MDVLPSVQGARGGASVRINHNQVINVCQQTDRRIGVSNFKCPNYCFYLIQVHGALLQIEHILRDAHELPQNLLAEVQSLVLNVLLGSRWFTTRYCVQIYRRWFTQMDIVLNID